MFRTKSRKVTAAAEITALVAEAEKVTRQAAVDRQLADLAVRREAAKVVDQAAFDTIGVPRYFYAG